MTSCFSCCKPADSTTTTASAITHTPISTGRKVGCAIAALVATVAFATFIAILAAPQVAFIAALATAFGGTATSLAVSGTLFAIGTVVSALFFARPECAKSEKETTSVPPREPTTPGNTDDKVKTNN